MKIHKKPRLDIFNSIAELAGYLKDDPASIDDYLDGLGKLLLTVYQDPAFKNNFPGLKDLKIGTIGKASRDIAEGLAVLRDQSVGVSFIERDKKLNPYVCKYGETPEGHVVFDIKWNNPHHVADSADLSQDDINACVYHLAVTLSKIVAKER